jgi:transcriptional antiterminator Rof (Rho-off)
LNFQVWDNKIFIEKSPEGFLIDVFDSNGKALYQINREYEKIKVIGAHKEAAIKEIKEDPTMKRQIKQWGSWENLLKMMKFTFPDFIPPIQNIEIADGRIYARTFQKKDNKEEYIVMDLEGKMLKKTYIPRVHPLSLKDQLIGVKMAVIKNEKLYYLKENEEQEVWELHVDEIK